MTDYQFQHGDPTWKELRRKALDDLYWFNDVVLGYGDLVPMRPKTHLAMCRFAERKTGEPALDDAPVQLILVPREVGKTSLITRGRTIQRICKDPNRSIMLGNEKEGNASKFLSSIQGEFESNTFLRALFPEVIPLDFNKVRWSATEMDLQRTTRRQEPTIFVTGVGGTVTGMHPDEIVCDDLISLEAMRNAKVGARQILEQVNDWIHTLWALLNKNASDFGITFIGTHWWHDDCYDHVLQHFGNGENPRPFLLRLKGFDDGTAQTIECQRVGDVAVLIRSIIEDGQSIFPEKYSLEQLAKMRMADPVLFAANYMNRPSDELTAELKESWLQHFEWVDTDRVRFLDQLAKERVVALGDLDRIILMDPGGFAKLGKQSRGDRMRPAMMLTGSTQDGLHLCLRAFSDKDTYLNLIRIAIQWCRQYGVRKIAVEQTAQQIVFVDKLREELAKAGVMVSIQTVTPRNQDKDQRILDMEPFFQQRRVYIGTSPEFLEFRHQFSQFPRSARRDLLDALAYGPVVWRKLPIQTQHHEQRQRKELELLQQRMSATITYGNR